jgi:hypothetical protein
VQIYLDVAYFYVFANIQKELELKVGSEATAIIKATSVMLIIFNSLRPRVLAAIIEK